MLLSDRTSTAYLRSSQLRLYFSSHLVHTEADQRT